jgi:hypothetical protein
MLLINENDIYVYFEIIKQNSAKRVLDVGMFLSRIKAVSRQVENLSINENVILDGVNITSEEIFPVYQTIYDSIITNYDWGNDYDLIIFLRANEFLDPGQRLKVWEQIKQTKAAVLSDTIDPAFTQFLINNYDAGEIKLGNNSYILAGRL